MKNLKVEFSGCFVKSRREAAHTEKESGTAKVFLLELHSASQPQTVVALDCECGLLCMIKNLFCAAVS